MSNPALAGKSADDRRFYTWGNERFWSVTTIIGGGVPKHLQAWAAKAVAELAWADLEAYPSGRKGAAMRRWSAAGRADVVARQAAGELTSIKLAKLTERDLGLRWLKGQPDRIRDAAAARGNLVHAAAEDLALDAVGQVLADIATTGTFRTTWGPELAPWMDGFLAFLREYRPEVIAAEATVFNREQAYAGTLDAIMRIRHPRLPSNPIVTDYKSGNGVYPEVAMQLASYARGEFIGLPDGVTTAELPADLDLGIGAVLHLTPRGAHLRPVVIADEVWLAFQYAREIYRWATETSRVVLLDELEPLTEEVA